ncbi:MAG: DUF3515 family protein [Actinomycetales bacterium]|nr:DUF3515 family protein [Actinomycetales bacterium]
MSPVRLRRPLALALFVLGPVALLAAGCATPAALDPAPSASDPVCAEVLRSLPDSIAGAKQRSTTTQASRAWGDPPITLRCGVKPLGPTTDRCITVEGENGVAVDWVVGDLGSADSSDSGSWAFTTYGRTPAVEVVVPVEYAGEDATSVLVSLGPSVAQLPQARECL